eukprot:IDg14259t1
MLHAAVTQHCLSNLSDAKKISSDNSAIIHLAYTAHYGSTYASSSRPGARHSSRSPSKSFPHRKRTLAELKSIKKRTRCLRCGEVGHWSAECLRRDFSMTDAIRARFAESGGNERAISEVLFTIVQEDDTCESF